MQIALGLFSDGIKVIATQAPDMGSVFGHAKARKLTCDRLTSALRLEVDTEDRGATPVLLTLALRVAILPRIRCQAEDDGLVTDLLDD